MTVSVPESYSKPQLCSFYFSVEIDKDETLCIMLHHVSKESSRLSTHNLINLPSGLREGSDNRNVPTLANEKSKE